jgi:hypothetical protein
MKPEMETWSLFVDETGRFADAEAFTCAVAGLLLPSSVVSVVNHDVKYRLQEEYAWLPWPMHATDMKCMPWMLARAIDVPSSPFHAAARQMQDLLTHGSPELAAELNTMVRNQRHRPDAQVRELESWLRRHASGRWGDFCRHMRSIVVDVRLVMRDVLTQASRLAGQPIHVVAMSWSGEGRKADAWLDAYSGLQRRAISLVAGRTAALPDIHVVASVQDLRVECPTTGKVIGLNRPYLARSYDPAWAQAFQSAHRMRVHWSCGEVMAFKGSLGGAWVIADWIANSMAALRKDIHRPLTHIESTCVTPWGATTRGVRARAAVGATGAAERLVDDLLLQRRATIDAADLNEVPSQWAREQVQTFVPEK